MAELRRTPTAQHALAREQRAELLRLVAAVPDDVGPDHPTVKALVAYRRSLHTPWWVGGSTAYLRVGGRCQDGRTNVQVGLAQMRALADCDDWGDAPAGWRL